jgi:hypothetical protein
MKIFATSPSKPFERRGRANERPAPSPPAVAGHVAIGHREGETTMMKSILFGAAALALAVTAAGAAEDTNSANFMMPACRDYLRRDIPANFLQGNCSGLIEASPSWMIPSAGRLE